MSIYSSVFCANEREESIWETQISTQTSFTGEQTGRSSIRGPCLALWAFQPSPGVMSCSVLASGYVGHISMLYVY